MKKKLTYGLLTLLIIGGLYIGLRFEFGLFTPFNFLTARQDIKNGIIQVVELGELPFDYKQRQNLSKTYGFSYYYYGCNVSSALINGTKYYNKTMDSYLEKKYGSDFWTKFEPQLDGIDETDTTTKLKSYEESN